MADFYDSQGQNITDLQTQSFKRATGKVGDINAWTPYNGNPIASVQVPLSPRDTRREGFRDQMLVGPSIYNETTSTVNWMGDFGRTNLNYNRKAIHVTLRNKKWYLPELKWGDKIGGPGIDYGGTRSWSYDYITLPATGTYYWSINSSGDYNDYGALGYFRAGTRLWQGGLTGNSSSSGYSRGAGKYGQTRLNEGTESINWAIDNNSTHSRYGWQNISGWYFLSYDDLNPIVTKFENKPIVYGSSNIAYLLNTWYYNNFTSDETLRTDSWRYFKPIDLYTETVAYTTCPNFKLL